MTAFCRRASSHETAIDRRMIRVTQIPCYTDPVANLTLAVDSRLLRQARMRALEQGTSVNSLVREYLEAYAGHPERGDLVRDILNMASESGAGSGNRTWNRDELHDR